MVAEVARYHGIIIMVAGYYGSEGGSRGIMVPW